MVSLSRSHGVVGTRMAERLVHFGLALVEWSERRRRRRDLLRLDEAGLKDIGLSRADVEGEIRKWPWEG